jgi:hypothetical protein
VGAHADGGFEGTVVSIYLAGAAGEPTRAVADADAVPGRGLVGDRYFLATGFYSHKPGPDRELTLIELETLEALRREHGIELAPGETRRNVVTQGVAAQRPRRPGLPGRPDRRPRHPPLRAVPASRRGDRQAGARTARPPWRPARPNPHRRHDPGRRPRTTDAKQRRANLKGRSRQVRQRRRPCGWWQLVVCGARVSPARGQNSGRVACF